MVARVVYGFVEFPGAAGPCVGARVSAFLYSDGQQVTGVAGDMTVGSVATLTTNSGYWQLELTPNSEISPSGTVWAVSIATPDERESTFYVTVPNTTGPHQAADIMADFPVQVSNLTQSWISVTDYGATGDGVTNDSAAVSEAASAWMNILESGSPAILCFSQGTYLVDGLTLSPSSDVVGGDVVGFGATLKAAQDSGSDYVISFSTEGTGSTWKHLSVRDLGVSGGGIHIRAGDTSEFFWDVNVDNVKVIDAPVSALRVSGVFETNITSSFFEVSPSASPTASNDSCVVVEKLEDGAQPSSVCVENVTTRGGYHGVYVGNAADVRLSGGSVLAAVNDGIYISSVGFTVRDIHVENNCLGTSGGSGVRAEGSGSVANVFAVANVGAPMSPYSGSTGQQFAVRCYLYGVDSAGSTTAGDMHVSDIVQIGTVSGMKKIRCTGGESGSTLRLTGTFDDLTSVTSPTSGVVVVNGVARAASSLPAAASKYRGDIRVKSGTGAEDKVCVCVLSSDGSTYKWIDVKDGSTVT